MIEVVTGRNALLYREALCDMFRLRHRALVDGMGYAKLRRPDGLQKDRFDTPEAIYLLLTEDDGTVIATTRLLSTLRPHVFSDVLPGLCAVKGVVRGEKILEATRICVDKARLGRVALETARKRIVVGMFEFCVRAGYEKLTLLIPTEVLFSHLVMGLDIKPLGLAVERDGVSHVAVVATATQRGLDALRLALNVMEPLVHYVGAPADDGLVFAAPLVPCLAAAG